MNIDLKQIKQLIGCVRDLIYTPISFLLNGKCTNATLITILINDCIRTQYILFKGKKYKLEQIGSFKDGHCTCCEEVIVPPDNGGGSSSGSGDTGIGEDTPIRSTRTVQENAPRALYNSVVGGLISHSHISHSFICTNYIEEVIDTYIDGRVEIVSRALIHKIFNLILNQAQYKNLVNPASNIEIRLVPIDSSYNQIGQGIPMINQGVDFIGDRIISYSNPINITNIPNLWGFRLYADSTGSPEIPYSATDYFNNISTFNAQSINDLNAVVSENFQI